MGTTLWTLAFCVLAAAEPAAAPPPAAGATIEVPAMLIRLIEQVDVPACEAGVLSQVAVKEGQLVEEGQLLAQIEDSQAKFAAEKARVDAAIAKLNATNEVNIRYARKSVEVAKAELKRSQESNDRYAKAISESEMDRLRLLVEKGSLEVEQAAHEFKVAGLMQQAKEADHLAAKQTVERHRITSPLAGLVVQVKRRRGEWVRPGDPVVRVLRIDRLRAEGFLRVQGAVQDLQGHAAKLVVDVPGAGPATFPATVVFVDPEIDPVNAQVRIWAEVENQGLRLRPGMRAKLVIEK